MTTDEHEPSAGDLPPDTDPRTVSVEVRTAPKIWAFLVTGVLLGAVAALIVTWISHAALVEASDDGTTEHSFIAAFGFMLVIFCILGAGLGSALFLLVDRLGRRRQRTVDVVVEPIVEE